MRHRAYLKPKDILRLGRDQELLESRSLERGNSIRRQPATKVNGDLLRHVDHRSQSEEIQADAPRRKTLYILQGNRSLIRKAGMRIAGNEQRREWNHSHLNRKQHRPLRTPRPPESFHQAISHRQRTRGISSLESGIRRHSAWID